MATLAFSDALIHAWRDKLSAVIDVYEGVRRGTPSFFPKLYAAFVVLNVACYWAAITTAFPDRAFGADWSRYALIQIPVGVLGAAFDLLSLVVTVYIIRRAVAARRKLVYLGHIGVDLVIALLATAWVLIVFSVSTWLADSLAPTLAPTPPPSRAATGGLAPAVEPHAAAHGVAPVAEAPPPPMALGRGEFLTRRSGDYRKRFVDAVSDPFSPENLKNIYFGVVMGASAMLPSWVHLYTGLISLLGLLFRPRPRTVG